MVRRLAGKPVAEMIAEETVRRVEALREAGISPGLAIVRVGERPGDLSYERSAAKRCQALGIEVRHCHFEDGVAQDALLAAIEELNGDTRIHGVLILRPLPEPLQDDVLCEALSVEKDVDGITSGSMAGVYAHAEQGFVPCTAEACIRTLEYYELPIEGRHAVVVGRSLVIGKPLSMLLLERHATVTICHTRTADLDTHLQGADIVVAASGHRGAIEAKHLREGQTVLDVGIHVLPDGRLSGDIDYEQAASRVDAITPVPGGIGAVTTAVLALHVAKAACRIHGVK